MRKGKTDLIPVPNSNILRVSSSDLRTQQSKLCRVQGLVSHSSKLCGKVCASDWADIGGDVGSGAVQSGQWSVPEVVARADTLHLVQGGVSSADDGDRAGGHTGAVVGCQEARFTKGLQSFDYQWPSIRPIGLDVYPEVKRLGRVGVKDTVVGWSPHKAGVWVLGSQYGKYGLDIQRVKRASSSQGTDLMADI